MASASARLVLALVCSLSGCVRSASRSAPGDFGSADASSAPKPAAPLFQVVDLFDLGRVGVHQLAYSNASQQLFVSFYEIDLKKEQDVIYQWDLVTSTQVARYTLDKDWTVAELTLSPDGSYVLVDQDHPGYEDSPPHQTRFALLDAKRRVTVSPDLKIYDMGVEVDFDAEEKRLRLTEQPIDSSEPRIFFFDVAGRRTTGRGFEPSRPAAQRVWHVPSSKAHSEDYGIYYKDDRGTDHWIIRDHWHKNYGITKDGRYIAMTIRAGDVLVWSTEQKRFVFEQRINRMYGLLVYDERRDRFLLGDRTPDGTRSLRALVRTGSEHAPGGSNVRSP